MIRSAGFEIVGDDKYFDFFGTAGLRASGSFCFGIGSSSPVAGLGSTNG
ncbi:MAG TPA: hypothetical protein VG713_12070 [Pirellulales bacterium]|nr:hypothetical protein [Pirellulales bacterium]